MSNKRNVQKIGTVQYSSKTLEKLEKYEKLEQVGLALIKTGKYALIVLASIAIGYIMSKNANELAELSQPTADSDEQPTTSVSENLETHIITVDNSQQVSLPKNNFYTDNNYNVGEQINISDCDFSRISVVLDAADATEQLYSELLETKNLFTQHGIDCSVVSYYESAINKIASIKQDPGKTVFVASVQTDQNKTDKHLVATNFYNNADALGKTPIAEGDKNSSDAFALAVGLYMPDATIQKGLASDTNNYDRRPSELERRISSSGLEGVKAITIRTSENKPLPDGVLGPTLLNGIVRASTLNNNLTYIVGAKSTDGYSAPGTIKDKYGYEIAMANGFYSDAPILARQLPAQLTNQVSISYNHSMDNIYLDSPIEQAHTEVTTLKSH